MIRRRLGVAIATALLASLLGGVITGATASTSSPAASQAGGGGIRVTAPRKANGRFRVTLAWSAGSDDHNVFLYSQALSIPCYKTGENERNHGYRGIRTVYYRNFNTTGSFTKTMRIAEARGGVTRLCAYLYGFNDVGLPHATARRIVR